MKSTFLFKWNIENKIEVIPRIISTKMLKSVTSKWFTIKTERHSRLDEINIL